VERGHPGWYENADTERVVSAINASRADLLVVGLPTPAQQRWVKENASRLSVPVIMTAGSYLDHVAERIDWYPQWVMRSRICWLYRLYRDPSRLWKRYSLELLRFGAILLQARLGVGQPGRA
jgi:N-acetylglucosaminyldiphosphoundecaprenol N-acetyl-beta-D-mannosaminyltransferase